MEATRAWHYQVFDLIWFPAGVFISLGNYNLYNRCRVGWNYNLYTDVPEHRCRVGGR